MKKSVLVLGITALGLAIVGIGALIFDIFVHAPGMGSFINIVDPIPVIISYFVFTFPALLYFLPILVGLTFFVLLIIASSKKKHKSKILTAFMVLVVMILITPIMARAFAPENMFSPLPVELMIYIQPPVLFQLLSYLFGLTAFILAIIASAICLAYTPVDRRKVLEQQLLKGQVHKEDPIVIPPTITPEEDEEPEAEEEKVIEEPSVVEKGETAVDEPKVVEPTQEPTKVETQVEVSPQPKEEVVAPKAKKSTTKKVSTTKASSTSKAKVTEAKLAEVKPKAEKKPKTQTKNEPVKPEAKVEAKPVAVEPKAAKEVKTPSKVEPKRVYHLNKREQDNKWTIIFTGGKKVLKLCNTQKEAIEYVQALCASNGGTYLVHNSKGANKGRIKKKA